MSVEDLQTPAFIVDKNVFKRNCQRMLDVGHRLGLKLRCHVKTHKTREGAILQTGGSCKGIVCSTIPEIELLADEFDDILYGVPLCPSKLQRCHDLKDRIGSFHVMLDSQSTLEAVEKFHAEHRGRPWSVFIKVDLGAKRAGLPCTDIDAIVSLAKAIATGPATTLRGLYAHDGGISYGKTTAEVENITRASVDKLVQIVHRLEQEGMTNLEYGIGCTPSCSHPVEEMSKLTEIHPGNYVFYDAQQLNYGNCAEQDIAVSVLTSVIGQYPARGEFLIDAGFTATTKQGKDALPSGHVIFKGFPNLRLRDQTQEIGIVCAVDGFHLNLADHPIGSKLEMIPYHSCATAAQFDVYHVREGSRITERWRPAKFW